MDGPKYIAGGDKRQIEIDRRRASAIRDLEDAFERARDNLAFEFGRVISNAIDDVADDSPGAFFAAQQSVTAPKPSWASPAAVAVR
jgi:hypothetical protein